MAVSGFSRSTQEMSKQTLASSQEDQEQVLESEPRPSPKPGFFRRMISKLKFDVNVEEPIRMAWGLPGCLPGSLIHPLVTRYWIDTRMQEHWEDMKLKSPRKFIHYLKKGYMEPIPTGWIQSGYLSLPYGDHHLWANRAEKRLYYFLNKGRAPDGSKLKPIVPLRIDTDLEAIISRGEERMTKQVKIDPYRLAIYQSQGDVFKSTHHVISPWYSLQVPNIDCATRTAACRKLATELLDGTVRLETMLLISASASMLPEPYKGIPGPDGVPRIHDQVSNKRVVRHLVRRVLQHMIPRTRREHPTQRGIDTVVFSTTAEHVGEFTASTFRKDWERIKYGDGANIMAGWQTVKHIFFTRQYAHARHGHFYRKYGWHPTPGMPKLSLLVFLDSRADNMAEFELELLGQSWACVTIVLVGLENCPLHHSLALDLERAAKYNPLVGFFDVQGRVCERLVVEDVLQSVYPVDAPQADEILKPEYDLRGPRLKFKLPKPRYLHSTRMC